MTDPIACPECDGTRGQQFGDLFLACRFCGGLGWVGGSNEPAERDAQEPPRRTPVWEHRIWRDPAVAGALACRYCLDTRQVVCVDAATKTMMTAACPACATVA